MKRPPKIVRTAVSEAGDSVYIEWETCGQDVTYSVYSTLFGWDIKHAARTKGNSVTLHFSKSGTYKFKIRKYYVGKSSKGAKMISHSPYSQILTFNIEKWNAEQTYDDLIKDLLKKDFVKKDVDEIDGEETETRISMLNKSRIKCSYTGKLGNESIKVTMDLTKGLSKAGKTNIYVNYHSGDGYFTTSAYIPLRKVESPADLEYTVKGKDKMDLTNEAIIAASKKAAGIAMREWQTLLLQKEGYTFKNLGFNKLKGADFK